MTLGLVGRKVGMTRLFTDDGDAVPVTVVDVSNNRVTQIKTPATDGYSAVQVTFGERRPSRVTKPLAGHFAKAGTEAGSVLREFHISEEQASGLKAGATIGADIFKVGQKVDVTGTTHGKGFSGVIKRHHFSSNRASTATRCRTTSPALPARTRVRARCFPGKRMAGHLGDVRSTAQNLEIVRIDAERQLLMIKGSLPGSKGGNVVVSPTVRVRA